MPLTDTIVRGSVLLAQSGQSTDDLGGTFWMPPQASTVANHVDWIFYAIYWLSVFFFVLIVALMIWFAWKYRRSQAKTDHSAPSHHTPLEVTWTIIPLLLAIGIFYIGLDGYVELVQPPANAYEVNVTGQKWNWTFEHRNGATSTETLVVPANTPVKLTMTSTDVLHSLFIPAFRVKQDVVPGRYSYLWFEATEPGVYQLLCTEYCGTQHSQMAAFVEVLPEEDFWPRIEQDAQWLDDFTDEQLHLAGLRLHARCASCHSLEADRRMTGPSFWEAHDQWGEERSGMPGVIVDDNYIRESILVPQAHIVETYSAAMPSFQGQLKEREVRALVEFIKRLDEVVDRTGAPVSPG